MHPSHRCFSLSNVNFKKTFKKKKRCSYHQEIPRELGTQCQEWGPETNYVYYVPWDKVGEAWIGDSGREEGVLARAREGVLEETAFGKSHPKTGRQMDRQAGAALRGRTVRGTWCPRGTTTRAW